jgi:antitoxin MazE
METVIRKWGKTLALRLNRSVMQAAGLELGQRVTIATQKGRLVIELMHTNEYELDELLIQMGSDNLPGEAGFGVPRGRESAGS